MKGNIKINDSENNLLIESDVITIDRNKDFITAKGNIKINDSENNLLIESNIISFDRKNHIIESNKNSNIKINMKIYFP